MSSLSSEFAKYSAKHPKSNPGPVSYGTSGLRARAETLDSIAFRLGILSAIRSQVMNGEAIGLMITASHNPAQDNGIKIIDCTGSMLEESWEPICTELANQLDDQLDEYVKNLLQKVNSSGNGLVFIGRDTRDSSEKLAESAADGVKAMDSSIRDLGLLTTPQLHYIVYAYNNSRGDPTENGYYVKFSSAFSDLCSSLKASITKYKPRVFIDCANGVGGPKMKLMAPRLEPSLQVELFNTGEGIVNHECGSSYVETQFKEPVNCLVNPADRWASFDGDADRIVYFYKKMEDPSSIRILDGDKIAALFSLYIKELLTSCGLLSKLSLQVIQTAYSNGRTTEFLKNEVGIHVECAATGVKNLMRKAVNFDISVFFEANGHGSVLYNDKALNMVKDAAVSDETGSALLLLKVFELMNQATGDAISDLLLVEAILRAKDWTIEDWDAIYETSPSRLLKAIVPDRNFVKTNEIATQVLEPKAMQDDINELVQASGKSSRVTVRASGTEDIVRIYAEAETQEKADKLAQQVVDLVLKYSQSQ